LTTYLAAVITHPARAYFGVEPGSTVTAAAPRTTQPHHPRTPPCWHRG